MSAAPKITFLPSERNICASLAMEVVFPQPFTPATMITVGPAAAKRIGSAGWASSTLSFCLISSRMSSSSTTRALKLATYFVDQFLRGLDAHVGLDECLEQLLQKRLVDQPAAAFENVADVGIEQLGGLFQTLLEFVE